MQTEWEQLAASAHLVIALDLDGTLIPFARTPAEAVVDGEAAALLEALPRLPNVTVGVITGRPRSLVADLVGRFPNIAFAAEHGVWRFADGAWDAAMPPLVELEEIALSLSALAQRFAGALVERKSCSVCLHWRQVSPEQHDAVIVGAEMLVDEWLETIQNWIRLGGWVDAADLLVDAAEIGGDAVRRNSAAFLAAAPSPLPLANGYGPRIVRLHRAETDALIKADWTDLRRQLGI